MDLQQKQVAHFFAGAGGSVSGMEAAGWNSRFAVEMDAHWCQTLRNNFPGLTVFEGPIQQLMLKDYPGYFIVCRNTFPQSAHNFSSYFIALEEKRADSDTYLFHCS